MKHFGARLLLFSRNLLLPSFLPVSRNHLEAQVALTLHHTGHLGAGRRELVDRGAGLLLLGHSVVMGNWELEPDNLQRDQF